MLVRNLCVCNSLAASVNRKLNERNFTLRVGIWPRGDRWLFGADKGFAERARIVFAREADCRTTHSGNAAVCAFAMISLETHAVICRLRFRLK